MGEAKRRKQKLGSEYGQPLGLNAEARRHLIQENFQQLLSAHNQTCGYPDCFTSPTHPQFRPPANPNSNQPDLQFILEDLVRHWQNTFNHHYPRSALQSAVASILSDKPIMFTGKDSLVGHRIMTPIIPLPSARKYFRGLVASSKIQLSQHYILLRDVLTVLATESARPLLQQLLLSEFNDAIKDAISERAPWLTPHLHPDGWLDLTEEVGFQGANRALAGLLTLLVTLPWEIQLKTLLAKRDRKNSSEET